MANLHIEHAITDLDTWLRTFNAFADARRRGGVLEERIWQPVGDPGYIVIDLTFESVNAAEDFHSFLLERVWSCSESAPALVGRPRAVVLHPVVNNSAEPPGGSQSGSHLVPRH
ncbi:hypothetical protein OQ968_22680 [Mycobacterium sp. 663a-19]|uniref:hypothetical protein n=1 Tax=Mycobacterium sp. 663a-19 TaxID=2986148 RepID=UPI002D1EF5AB|nr:hypothetical protein [Mycobacterium sp. 663a-19]MEB3984058.1 hypothetical protein [Mycobacterium sp. 663a-19]